MIERKNVKAWKVQAENVMHLYVVNPMATKHLLVCGANVAALALSPATTHTLARNE